MSVKLIKTGLFALALGASAAATAADFNYNYVEGGFGEIDDGDVIFLNAAHDIQNNIGLVGGLFTGDTDYNVDVTGIEFGAQYHQALKSNLGFNAGLKILHVQVDLPSWARGDDSDTGLIANAGLRFRVAPKIDLEGSLKLSSNDMIDDGLGAEVGGRFYLDQHLSFGVGLAVDTELDGLYAGVRYDM